MIQESLVTAEQKALRILPRLFFKRSKIEAFSKIKQVARVVYIGSINDTIRCVV